MKRLLNYVGAFLVWRWFMQTMLDDEKAEKRGKWLCRVMGIKP